MSNTPLIDIKAVKDQARKEVSEARANKAKNALIRQLLVVDAAEQVVRSEHLKLADLEQQIADGSF